MSAVSPSPGRFSPGRKTPPGVSAPSAGLRPLNVSRVKCGGGPCRGHSVLPCTGNTICLHCAFIKGARFGICLRKHVVAATGPSPFKVGDNQRPERTMSGVRKPSPESSVPGETLTGGRRRNQFWRGYGSPSVLNHDHPSNGWFARPYKGTVTGQRLKTLAFTLFKPLCP